MPGLLGLLEVNQENVAGKAPPPLIGRRSRRSLQRAQFRRVLKAIVKRSGRANIDSSLVKSQVKVIEILGRNTCHWRFLQLVSDMDGSNIICFRREEHTRMKIN